MQNVLTVCTTSWSERPVIAFAEWHQSCCSCESGDEERQAEPHHTRLLQNVSEWLFAIYFL